ncbi:hypothetical protein MNBD_GAMMA25-2197 [hydrothermal vent metagenome]|uniref:Uncharacterized protein n=1 Tax=hydrothermal vent metagenome TaxID=652676 RepID=A0A3B1BEF3_9ZZZZ
MKKLYTLKSWFSLVDAAERLGAGLGESVTVNDVLQLVVEGHLPLSWYTRHIPARKVAPYTALFGRGFRPEFNKLFPNTHETSEDTLKAVESWEPLDGEDAIVYLDGPFRLELDQCGALMDWIHAHLTHTGGELISLDGFFVSEPNGALWQIMEHNSGGRYKSPDGNEKELKPFYHPSGIFPDEAELIIQRRDIEFFENSLAESSNADLANLSQRTETSYLNMIAALLDVITEGIPSPETISGQLGPATEFKNEAKLITAIAHCRSLFYFKIGDYARSGRIQFNFYTHTQSLSRPLQRQQGHRNIFRVEQPLQRRTTCFHPSGQLSPGKSL